MSAHEEEESASPTPPVMPAPEEQAAVIIQAFFRGCLSRSEFSRTYLAALRIQSWIRTVWRHRDTRAYLGHSLTRVQALWRGYRVRKLLSTDALVKSTTASIADIVETLEQTSSCTSVDPQFITILQNECQARKSILVRYLTLVLAGTPVAEARQCVGWEDSTPTSPVASTADEPRAPQPPPPSPPPPPLPPPKDAAVPDWSKVRSRIVSRLDPAVELARHRSHADKAAAPKDADARAPRNPQAAKPRAVKKPKRSPKPAPQAAPDAPDGEAVKKGSRIPGLVRQPRRAKHKQPRRGPPLELSAQFDELEREIAQFNADEALGVIHNDFVLPPSHFFNRPPSVPAGSRLPMLTVRSKFFLLYNEARSSVAE